MFLTSILIGCVLWVESMAAPWQINYRQPYQRIGPYGIPEDVLQAAQEREWRINNQEWEKPSWRVSDNRAYNPLSAEYGGLEEMFEDSRDSSEMDDSFPRRIPDLTREEEDGGYLSDSDISKIYQAVMELKREEVAREREEEYREDPMTYFEVDEDQLQRRPPLDGRIFEALFDGAPDAYEESTAYEGYPQGYGEVPREQQGLLQANMRLKDLTATEGYDSTRVTEEEGVPENPPMTAKRAQSLLKQLEAEEHRREVKQNIAEETKEPIGMNELAEMFGKQSEPQNTKRAELSSLEDESEESTESDDSDDSDDSNDSDDSDDEVRHKEEEEELELVKEENELLIQALQYAPIEKIKSIDDIKKMKELIGQAVSRQDTVDNMHRKVGEM